MQITQACDKVVAPVPGKLTPRMAAARLIANILGLDFAAIKLLQLKRKTHF